MTTTTRRTAARRTAARWTTGAAAAAAMTAGLVLAAPLAASAHVTATPDGEATAGSYGLVTFAFSHGCDDSPTRAISIDIPDGLDSVTPTVTAGWDVAVTRENGDGMVQNITYTADEPVESGLRVAFDLSVKYAADAAGETLVFPVTQTCVTGETDWTEVAADGEDPESLDAPAPTVTVAAAADDDATAASSADESASTTGIWLGTGGLLVGAAGLVTGIVALRRARR